MSKHSLPDWVGWLMVTVAVVLIFPSFFLMTDAVHNEVWQVKLSEYGTLYTVGTLFWAFASWIVIFIIMGIGIDTIRSRDKNAD